MIELKYKRFDDSIKTIADMKDRAMMNALASYKSISKASKTLKISIPLLREFMYKNNITVEDLKEIRKDYKSKLIKYGSDNKNINTKKE